MPLVLLIVQAARPGDSQLASRAEDSAGPVEPIDIGSRRELFVDDYLVDRFVAPPPPGPPFSPSGKRKFLAIIEEIPASETGPNFDIKGDLDLFEISPAVQTQDDLIDLPF